MSAETEERRNQAYLADLLFPESSKDVEPEELMFPRISVG